MRFCNGTRAFIGRDTAAKNTATYKEKTHIFSLYKAAMPFYTKTVPSSATKEGTGYRLIIEIATHLHYAKTPVCGEIAVVPCVEGAM